VAHYLFRARYKQQGLQGLIKEGASGRVAAIEKVVNEVGGRVIAQYWAFGEDDYLLIAELVDNTTAAALATTVAASGAASVTTTVLLTAPEIDAAVRRTISYRPPGA
jgi:uncharacterized protein with GYD domain